MIRRPPRSTSTDTRFPYTTLFRSSTGELIWSKELFRLYGRSPAAGVPTREEWASLVHPEDHRDCPWIFPDRLFRTGILTTEFRVRSEDGFRTVSCRGSSFLGDGGMQRMIGMERSEEHTSELQSLMRLSYAVFCLK